MGSKCLYFSGLGFSVDLEIAVASLRCRSGKGFLLALMVLKESLLNPKASALTPQP